MSYYLSKYLSNALVVLLLNIPVVLAGNLAKESGTLEDRAYGRSEFVLDANVNINGSIKIVSNQTGEVRAIYTKNAETSSEAESKRFIDLIEIRLDISNNDEIRLEILSPPHAPWEGSEHKVWIELYIEIPEKTDITGTCKFMNLEIEGPFADINLDCEFSDIRLSDVFGSANITTTFGDVNLNTMKGNIDIETNDGDIEVRNIEIESGKGLLKTSHGEISMTGIAGSMEAYTDYAPIKASRIDASDGSIVLRTKYAPIDISEVDGEIICETDYYPVTLTNSRINHGFSRLETSYAPISAQFAELENCDLYIESSYSDIDLSIPADISTRLAAYVDERGKIHTKGLSLKPIQINPNHLEGIMGDGGGARIEIKVSGIGNIQISGR